jgi:CheY-like chemotaxis protein
MTAWGFDSAACSSGNEALAVLSAAANHGIKIDCALLDYHMPEMNGADLARAMRTNSGFAGIPIVMLTSVDNMENGRTFTSLGIQGQLTKPARSQLLLETIVSVLQDELARQAGEGISNGVTIARQMGASEAEIEDDGDDVFFHEVAAPVRASQQPDFLPPQEETVVSEILARSDDDRNVDCNETGSLPAERPEDTDLPEGLDILLCEDNGVNQIVFSQILLQTDYRFKIANNGEEGLELYRRYGPRLILMDVSMPKMNGFEATQAIRESEKRSNQHTPIIGVTAHAIKGDMEKCTAAGMDDYLSKPISPDRLVEKIEKWLPGNSDRRALA